MAVKYIIKIKDKAGNDLGIFEEPLKNTVAESITIVGNKIEKNETIELICVAENAILTSALTPQNTETKDNTTQGA